MVKSVSSDGEGRSQAAAARRVLLPEVEQQGRGVATRRVAAVLEARRVAVDGERHGTGADGLYRFAHETYEGTSTGDGALSGRLVLEIHSADNVTQGFLGLVTGTATIYDAGSARLKVVADVVGVDAPSAASVGVRIDGFLRGRVVRSPPDPDLAGGPMLLFANFSICLDAAGGFVGNLGCDTPVAPQNTAVLQDVTDFSEGRHEIRS